MPVFDGEIYAFRAATGLQRVLPKSIASARIHPPPRPARTRVLLRPSAAAAAAVFKKERDPNQWSKFTQLFIAAVPLADSELAQQ